MKISCTQASLSRGLSIVGRAISARPTMPILGHIMVSTDADGMIKLSATNLELVIHCWLDGVIESNGAIAVPARTISDLVNTFPPGDVLMEIAPRTQTLNICAGRSKANIRGMDAQECTAMYIPEQDDEHGILVNADSLRMAIEQVVFAAATDDSRPILTGVIATFDGAQLTLVAADGFRLSVRTIELPQSVSDPFSVIIPANALVEVGRISRGTGSVSVTVSPTNNQIVFKFSNAMIISQLIDGKLLDYRQIIPNECPTSAIVDTAPFLRACKTALVFARDGNYVASLRIAPGSMTVSSTSAEAGDDTVTLDATVDGDDIEIALNIKYLLDVLGVISDTQVSIETITHAHPCVIRPVGDAGFIHVIMPIHR